MGLVKKVLFHVNEINERGTTISTVNYAKYNEILLGNESFICFPNYKKFDKQHSVAAYNSYKKIFGDRLFMYENQSDVNNIIDKTGAKFLYIQKGGHIPDMLETKYIKRNVKIGVHAVFQHNQPHGHKYGYISEWLSKHMSNGRHPFVPYMIDLPNTQEDMREELGIPEDAVVFGRHGGLPTFNYEPAHQVVYEVAKEHPNIYFLFLNTNKFCLELDNIIHLSQIVDLNEKVKFINTCDAMLHARTQGESFGLSVAEFSSKNKPIITNTHCRDKAHLYTLGDKAIRYANGNQLKDILTTFIIDSHKDWVAYGDEFGPKRVMNKFNQVYLT